MPNRVQWDPSFSVGHDALDDQHRHILAQCNLLADHCVSDDGVGDDRIFAESFDALMAFAREHFAAEEALLAGCAYPDLEDYRYECEEYAYLAAEIVTTENFDKLELQRFLALWWVGHILGAARRQRAFLAQ
jgi:hemerythrin